MPPRRRVLALDNPPMPPASGGVFRRPGRPGGTQGGFLTCTPMTGVAPVCRVTANGLREADLHRWVSTRPPKMANPPRLGWQGPGTGARARGKRIRAGRTRRTGRQRDSASGRRAYLRVWGKLKGGAGARELKSARRCRSRGRRCRGLAGPYPGRTLGPGFRIRGDARWPAPATRAPACGRGPWAPGLGATSFNRVHDKAGPARVDSASSPWRSGGTGRRVAVKDSYPGGNGPASDFTFRQQGWPGWFSRAELPA